MKPLEGIRVVEVAAWMFVPALIVGCTQTPDKNTLAQLRTVRPDTQDVKVEHGLDKAMESYRRYLLNAMTEEEQRMLRRRREDSDAAYTLAMLTGSGSAILGLAQVDKPPELAPRGGVWFRQDPYAAGRVENTRIWLRRRADNSAESRPCAVIPQTEQGRRYTGSSTSSP